MNAVEFAIVKRLFTRAGIFISSHSPKRLDGAHIQLCPADLTTLLVSTSYMAIGLHVRKGRDWSPCWSSSCGSNILFNIRIFHHGYPWKNRWDRERGIQFDLMPNLSVLGANIGNNNVKIFCRLQMARTQKNKATAHHLGLLKARLAKLRRELITPKGGGGVQGEG